MSITVLARKYIVFFISSMQKQNCVQLHIFIICQSEVNCCTDIYTACQINFMNKITAGIVNNVTGNKYTVST